MRLAAAKTWIFSPESTEPEAAAVVAAKVLPEPPQPASAAAMPMAAMPETTVAPSLLSVSCFMSVSPSSFFPSARCAGLVLVGAPQTRAC